MNRKEKIILGLILLLFAVMSCVGITWGLPSRSIDKYLFGDQKPWSGEKIYRLAVADGDEKFSPGRGADVDVDPLDKNSNEPILLTGTDEDIAKIYLRYRLYTYQPDEMITMMALSGMRPSEFKFDPRLYQYGGLFIYPVGALVKFCGMLGLIEVRSDVVYYLDNPDEFGKFYIVARAYSALWGLIGVLTVFAITRRLATSRAALLAALLFTLMPVVVCMAHEGKPHLPGAVLMLLAVYFAMRYLGIQYFTQKTSTTEPHASACAVSLSSESPRGLKPAAQEITQTTPPLSKGGQGGVEKHAHASVRHATPIDWWLMCICCGAAFGMVLSSGPIFILIPLVAYLSTINFPNRAALPKRAREGSTNNEHSPEPHASACAVSLSSESPRGLKPAAQEPTQYTPPLTKGGQGGVNKYDHTSEGMSPNLVTAFKKTVVGTIIGFTVYFITNPYVLINAFTNREVLKSNFGNSFAMYEISRIAQGFVRVIELTVEGATLPILVLGAIALIVAIKQKRFSILPLAIPALLFFAQFVLIGAGKPAEYGRFGIFPNVALAIGAACILSIRWTKRRDILNWIPASFVTVVLITFGGLYLINFHEDSTENASRIRARCGTNRPAFVDLSSPLFWNWWLKDKTITVTAEPAPYACPPLPFNSHNVYLLETFSEKNLSGYLQANPTWHIKPVDKTSLPRSGLISTPGRRLYKYLGRLAKFFDRPTPISWANKPFEIRGENQQFAP